MLCVDTPHLSELKMNGANWWSVGVCSLLFTARRYVSAVLAVIVCLSVRLSVCHTLVLCQNGSTQNHGNNASRRTLVF